LLTEVKDQLVCRTTYKIRGGVC